MGFSTKTIALFDECERLANQLSEINPADDLLFYSNLADRTDEEKVEMTILFIENFFPEGAPTDQVSEKVFVLALSSFKIALERSIEAAPLLLSTMARIKDMGKGDRL
jgi:hypothetical protein